MLYNKPGTPYYKTAMRIKSASDPLLAELDVLATSAPFEVGQQRQSQLTPPAVPPSPEAGTEPSSSSPTVHEQAEVSEQEEQQSEEPAQSTPLHQPQPSLPLPVSHPMSTTVTSISPNLIGNLEPPLSFLDLLLSEAVVEDLQTLSDYILTTAPLPYMLRYELGEPVPPPPAPPTPTPPPTPPPVTARQASQTPSAPISKRGKSKDAHAGPGPGLDGGKEAVKGKPRRNKRAENEKRKEKERSKASEARAGFRLPGLRTRRAAAVEAAFEQEAAAGFINDVQQAMAPISGATQEVDETITVEDEEEEEEAVSVEPEAETGAEAGLSRTAPTSEAQVEEQVEIDLEGDGDVEMLDSEDAAAAPGLVPDADLDPSSTQPSVEPTTHQATPSAEVEDDAISTGVSDKLNASSSNGIRDHRATKRKRPSHSAGTAPPAIVKDVDKKDTFLNFDKGWILAEGSRRGGRKPPEIMWPTKPKKAKHSAWPFMAFV